MELHFHNDEYITPTGTLTQNLSHPFLKAGNGIELSLFYEHRYAFFFWNKWTRRLLKKELNTNPPCLVTFPIFLSNLQRSCSYI